MKQILLILSFFIITSIAYSQTTTYVNAYTRSDGTYVPGHYKTTSDNTNTNNYSTQGNTNTYTGVSGTKPKDYSVESYNYSSNKNIQTGPNGGQYYINSNGNKTYVPKVK
jgi:lipopolysaccharide export LptBFGC system permease protein LptF